MTACWFIIKSASITLCNSQLPVKDVGVNRRVIRKGTRSVCSAYSAYSMEIFFMSSRFATVFALFYYPLCAVCPVIYLCTYKYVYILTVCVCVYPIKISNWRTTRNELLTKKLLINHIWYFDTPEARGCMRFCACVCEYPCVCVCLCVSAYYPLLACPVICSRGSLIDFHKL